MVAAERRKLIGSLSPSGPKRLGGDSNIMASLTPVQAAAMAAERRILDDLWCASESCGHSSVVDVSDDDVDNQLFKRSAETLNSSTSGKDTSSATSQGQIDAHGELDSNERGGKRIRSGHSSMDSGCSTGGDHLSPSTSGSVFIYDSADNTDGGTIWECSVCTLFNKVGSSHWFICIFVLTMFLVLFYVYHIIFPCNCV